MSPGEPHPAAHPRDDNSPRRRSAQRRATARRSRPRRTGIFKHPFLLAIVGASAVVLGALVPITPSILHAIQGSCHQKLEITAPASGEEVAGPRGAIIKGKACNLHQDTGWLFDYDHSDHTYYEDYDQVPGPLVTRNGNWAFSDQPMGNEGDDRETYTVTLIQASAACSRILQALKPDQDDTVRLTRLPSSCRVADTTDVIVSWPSEK
jgi:hypothetical protein